MILPFIILLFAIYIKIEISRESPTKLNKVYNTLKQLKQSPCNDALLNILNDKKAFEFYANNSADALNSLGNFDNCLMGSNKTRYFSMEINNMPILLLLGLCVPGQCRTEDMEPLKPSIAQIMTDLLEDAK